MSETRPIESSANAKKFLDQLAQTDALSVGTQTSLRNAMGAPPAAGVVRHDAAQSLTSDQKAQARTNIEATRLPPTLDHPPGNADVAEVIEVTANFGNGEETVVLTGGHLGPQDNLGGEWVTAENATPYVAVELSAGQVEIRGYSQGLAGGQDSDYTVNEQVLPWLVDWTSAVLTGGASGVPVVTLTTAGSVKTTGTLATYDGRLYANHGSDDAPDWQEVVVPAEIDNFVTRTGASQTVSSPKIFSGANLYSGPNIFTQPVTVTNPATAASHLLDMATADTRLAANARAAISGTSIVSNITPTTIRQITLTPGVYIVRMFFRLSGTVNTGTRHGYACIGGAAIVRFLRYRNGALSAVQQTEASFDLGLAEATTTAWIEGTINVTATTDLAMQAAQNTSHADTLNVIASSYLHIIPTPNGTIV